MDLVRLAKKHLALLLPIGIALGAVLLFVPTILAGKGVTEEMQVSVSSGGQVDSLKSNTPSANQYKEEEAFQNKHASDANNVVGLTEQTSKREPLVYGIFPEPNETSSMVFTNFGKAYRKAVENLVTDMRGRDCPTEAEIADVTRYGSSAAGTSGTGGVVVEAGSSNEAIIERLCTDRAESIPVYASPDIFSGYEYWDNYNFIGRPEAIDDCWKTQMAYWIEKDIVDTIAKMDKDSNSVFKSPIKRLVGISFSGAFKDAASRQPGASATADMPHYVLSQTDGTLTVPWTERVSNAEMDVVHFAVSVILSNKAVEPFMKELCSLKPHTFKGWLGEDPPEKLFHNQITVLRSSIEPIIASTGMTADRYKYGDEAVVQLNLVCEYVFNKAGFVMQATNPPLSIRPTSLSERPAGSTGESSPPPPRTTPRPPGRRSSSSRTSEPRGGGSGSSEE